MKPKSLQSKTIQTYSRNVNKTNLTYFLKLGNLTTENSSIFSRNDYREIYKEYGVQEDRDGDLEVNVHTTW